MKKNVLWVLVGLVLASFLARPVMAAKPRVWKSVPATKVATTGSQAFLISAKLTGWKQYLTIGFRGVATTSGITYELIYQGNATDQGVYGDVKPTEGNTSRVLFLGTCSHGACTSYKNIHDMHLTITYKTKDGQTLVKKYKVKY